MIPNAATTTIKNRRKNITVRSSRTASKYWLFMSIQVWAYSRRLEKSLDLLFHALGAVGIDRS